MSTEQMLLLIIVVPLLLGLVSLILGRRNAFLARLLGLVGTAVPLYWAFGIWKAGAAVLRLPQWKLLGGLANRVVFNVDALNGFMLAGAAFFALISARI